MSAARYLAQNRIGHTITKICWRKDCIEPVANTTYLFAVNGILGVSFLKLLILVFVSLFVLPAVGTAAWWATVDRPSSWSTADWSASGVLPAASSIDGPAIYLMAARTGGLKGAFSVHCWIVIKRDRTAGFDRYDKVGWGLPVRKNAYAADGRWYSNKPEIIASVQGPQAARLVARAEAAIAAYPYQGRGDYTIWPGPNSNSFVAHVMRAIPEMDARMPSNAVGRDFAPGLFSVDVASDWSDIHATIGGLVGFAAGVRSGLEFHLFGLVAGVDILRPAIKIPAYGRLGLSAG